MASPFRIYAELGADGYPPEWHTEIKHAVRAAADHRCVRCGHPYRNGEHGNGEWSPCDNRCTHKGQVRIRAAALGDADPWRDHFLDAVGVTAGEAIVDEGPTGPAVRFAVEAHWRVLTVHHLNGVKADCRWWNLVSLCQRCHLTIQGRVVMARVWPWEHSEWFKPYVAGWYALAYLGEDLTRNQVDARLDELLSLERAA